MPSWLIKSAIHHAIHRLPNSRRCNEFFQERIAKSLGLSTGSFEFKLDYCRRYLEEFLKLNPHRAESFTALELGTGWYPIIPIGLWLSGASEIHSFDIEPHLRGDRLKMLLELLCEYGRKGQLQKLLPRVRPERLEQLQEISAASGNASPGELLEKIKIHTLVRDAQATGLTAGTVDLIFSWSVFEYVPRFVMSKLLAEFHRVGREGAVMAHYIDLTDQYHKFDKTIGPFNFLKFSDRAWNLLQSPLTPLNRLRMGDFRNIFCETGFEIVKEDATRAKPETLDAISLAPQFRNFSRDDLLVERVVFIARKK